MEELQKILGRYDIAEYWNMDFYKNYYSFVILQVFMITQSKFKREHTFRSLPRSVMEIILEYYKGMLSKLFITLEKTDRSPRCFAYDYTSDTFTLLSIWGFIDSQKIHIHNASIMFTQDDFVSPKKYTSCDNKTRDIGYTKYYKHVIITRPRKQRIAAVCALDNWDLIALSDKQQFYRYVFEEKEWKALELFARDQIDCVLMQTKNNNVMIIGGRYIQGEDYFSTKKCMILDTQTMTLKETTKMINPRHAFACVIKPNGNIVALAGVVGTDRNNWPTVSCEEFDFSTEKWKLIADIPSVTFDVSAVFLPNNKIFLTGRNSFIVREKTRACIYDCAADKWREVEFPVKEDFKCSLFSI